MNEQVSQDVGSQGFMLVGETDKRSVTITDSIKVGRDAACELAIQSGKVSRVHAIVSANQGALWVEDQKSTNGTFVNGTKIDNRAQLNNGDQVRFGDRGFKVVALAESEEPSAGGTTIIAGVATLLQVSEQGAAAKAPKDPPAAAFGKTSERPAAAASTTSPEPGPGAGTIPASWADSNQLETSSQTAFVPRRPSAPGDAKEQRLPPLEAIRQARETCPPDVAILVGLTKPVRGKPILLGRPDETRKWELGRGKTGDILIDHESVSGRHAQVIGEQGRWKVVNLMSVNGTFVNDRKVLSAFLNSGDCIRMGVVEMAFDAPVSKTRSRAGEGLWARFLSLFRRK